MQRGKQTLYNNIVPSSTPEVGEKGKRNIGLEDRRDAMAYRYYFYATISRLRYDDCLLNLSNEFFLQPDTIIKELQMRIALINQLVADKITTAELRKKYPFYNWMPRFI